MKVKDYPNLSKDKHAVISTDSDSYQKRLRQIRERKRIDGLENKNKQFEDDLKNLNDKMDLILRLLQKE